MRLTAFLEENDEVLAFVASERQKQALEAVSPLARLAIEEEILPQIEGGITSVKAAKELCESTKKSIDFAFSSKNEIYTRLVQHKTIDQSDAQFLEDLLMVMDEWLRKTLHVLDGDTQEVNTPEPQKVEVTIRVETAPRGKEDPNVQWNSAKPSK